MAGFNTIFKGYKRVEDTSSNLEDIEDEVPINTTPLQPRKSIFSRTLQILGSLILISFACIGLLTTYRSLLTYTTTSLSPSLLSCYCGTSIPEALTLGCTYDSLEAAWLPPSCRDDALTAEFERSGDGPNGTWLYYADPQFTKPISIEEVAMLADKEDHRFYMNHLWHKVHCVFAWRKEARAREAGKQVLREGHGERHIKHCQEVMLGRERHGTFAGVVLGL